MIRTWKMWTFWWTSNGFHDFMVYCVEFDDLMKCSEFQDSNNYDIRYVSDRTACGNPLQASAPRRSCVAQPPHLYCLFYDLLGMLTPLRSPRFALRTSAILRHREHGVPEWLNNEKPALGNYEWMNECVFIYRTHHILSQGGVQF